MVARFGWPLSSGARQILPGPARGLHEKPARRAAFFWQAACFVSSMPSLNQTNAWSIASLKGATPVMSLAAAKPGATADSDWDFSFHNLLGIVNPLQHLPLIGPLYRAITGDKIGTPEKIAGDALYGGLWGAVSGVADAAFAPGRPPRKEFPATRCWRCSAAITAARQLPAIAAAACLIALARCPGARPDAIHDADVVALTNALAQKGASMAISPGARCQPVANPSRRSTAWRPTVQVPSLLVAGALQ